MLQFFKVFPYLIVIKLCIFEFKYEMKLRITLNRLKFNKVIYLLCGRNFSNLFIERDKNEIQLLSFFLNFFFGIGNKRFIFFFANFIHGEISSSFYQKNEVKVSEL